MFYKVKAYLLCCRSAPFASWMFAGDYAFSTFMADSRLSYIVWLNFYRG